VIRGTSCFRVGATSLFRGRLLRSVAEPDTGASKPIELAFSKLKSHLRKAAEHTIPRLLRRIGSVVTDFSAQECTNFFRHAGYVRT